MVVTAEAVGVQGLHHLACKGRQGKRGAHPVARVQRIGKVLDVQVDLEARLEVRIHHHRRLGVHHRAARKSALDRLEHQVRVHPRLAHQRERLRHRRYVQRHDDLVGQLGRVPRPDRPAVHRTGAHHQQDLPHLVEEGLLSAHHDRKRPVHRLRLSPGNRRVQHAHLLLRAGLLHLLARKRGDGGHVDEDQALGRPLQHPALAHHHALDVGAVGQHRDHQGHPRRNIGRACRRTRTGRHHVLHVILVHIEAHHLVARLQQVLCHGLAHDA
ncbi:hypothetical protein SDC9_165538 [bioreactor metagenome]|uniref:Uncharacterized protein n=1 Tax=bioreactor metagenome TaxID=1076179 RepID=A0A645FWZ6_9ZZZZ